MRYIALEEVLALHATVVRETTGSLGVRDLGALKGCLERPKTSIAGQDMFSTVFEKAAAYMETIARNHPFLDGNKRTAFVTGAHFLSLNGIALAPQQGELVEFMLWVVTQKPAITEVADWLAQRST